MNVNFGLERRIEKLRDMRYILDTEGTDKLLYVLENILDILYEDAEAELSDYLGDS